MIYFKHFQKVLKFVCVAVKKAVTVDVLTSEKASMVFEQHSSARKNAIVTVYAWDETLAEVL